MYATFKDLSGLSADLAGKLLLDDVTGDVVLQVHGERLSAHRAILAARSPMFHAMFFGQMRESAAEEVEVNTFAPATMKLLLRFVYSGSVEDVRLEDMVPLMACADHYGVSALTDAISRHLQDSISPETACVVLALARTYKQESIVERYLSFILTHAQQVMKTEGFLDLDVSVLTKVLEADDARIEEIDLFKALVRWYRHWAKEPQAAANERQAEKLFGSVRYGQMTGRQLVVEVKPLAGDIVPHDLYVQALELVAAPEVLPTGDSSNRQRARRQPPIGTIQTSDPIHLAVQSTTVRKIGPVGWNCTAVVEPSTPCTRFIVERLADPQNGVGIAIFDPERVALRGSTSGYPNPNQWGAECLVGLYGTGVFFGIITEQPVRWHTGLLVEVSMHITQSPGGGFLLRAVFTAQGSDGERMTAEGTQKLTTETSPTLKLAIALFSPEDSVVIESAWPASPYEAAWPRCSFSAASGQAAA